MIPIRDTIRSTHKPIVVWLIIAINVFVFLIQYIVSNNLANGLVYEFGFVPSEFNELIWNHPISIFFFYPIVTSTFLHGGSFHLISNMWALWIFGDNVEDAMGHSRFAIFYILCGVIANLAHLASNMTSSIPVIGASGAIAGVMGAYFILYSHSRIMTLILWFPPIFFKIPAPIYLLIWFFTQIYSGTIYVLTDGGSASGIAWWAHIGGFIGGAILHKLFVIRPIIKRKRGVDL